ncbi:MAG: protein-glutamate O-methyltransferase [Heliomarina sp.]|uniref:protein-glutamate O-methyltransferase n=1 Tax=Heliomarina sp. TaxID=2917556 RepID=UPI004058DC17
MMNSLNTTSGRSSAASDVSYTSEDFTRISEILHSISGIKMPESNEALVFSRLSRRVRNLGLGGFRDYINILESGGDIEEKEYMVSALTTNTTRFFREDYHFATFSDDVLPSLVSRARKGERIRIWSAGCSSGEEPYSIAACILKSFPDAYRFDFRILGTDINKSVLSVAEKGVYEKSVLNSCGHHLIADVFEDEVGVSGRLSVREDLRKLITFRYMNFMDPWPVRGPFSTIFCRNVMIYMENDVQSMVWKGMSKILEPEGYLFIGHSERIGDELKSELELVGKTTFRKLEKK